MFLGLKHGWHVRLTTSLPSVSRLSKQCGILNTSEPCRPPEPIMGIALLLLYLGRICMSDEVLCIILLNLMIYTKGQRITAQITYICPVKLLILVIFLRMANGDD
jgi:hypothetical protein